MNALLTKYQQAQELRAWNARFTAPPVPTSAWEESDFTRWEKSRKSLPAFKDWLEAFKPERVNLTAFGKTQPVTRRYAASFVRALRRGEECKLRLSTVRSARAITCIFPDGKEHHVITYSRKHLS